MGYDFSQKQCIRALLKIGFINASTRRGKHFKYQPPKEYLTSNYKDQRPFITVPKHKFYCQEAIVREITKLCGEDMKRKFIENL
jgi:predicted RNA binding protein YcfA (HicA-like mRNA interferase family)